MLIVVPLLAAIAAVLSYQFLEGEIKRPWEAVAGRALGWAALGLLLVNLSCAGRASIRRPVVLLDASLSLQAAGGKWDEALSLARREGTPRLIGAAQGDTTPSGGQSLLGPALAAARGSSGRVVVITDGEIEDADDLPRDLLETATIRVLPRSPVPDLAVTRVEGATRLSVGDSLRLTVEVVAFHGSGGRRVTVTAREGSRVWLRGAVQVPDSGTARLELEGPLPEVEPGPHVLSIAIDSAGDAEARDDARLLLVMVAPTPGIVLLASPPTWESRFLLPALREVSGLPVRGYGRLESGRWRRLGSLVPAPAAEVADAVRRADLIVTLGDASDVTRGARARGRWRWLGAGPGAADPGDWYLTGTGDGPLAGGLAGLPIDSLPPAVALARLAPVPGGWTALNAQAGRRGVFRPAAAGGDSAGVRTFDLAADGLWRWAFTGGMAEQAYRSLIASAVSWLLEGGGRPEGSLRVTRAVVQRGRPVVFEWAGAASPGPAEIRLDGPGGARTDTLRFDGAGKAELLLAPGTWRYRSGDAEGMVAVEEFSTEWLPRARTVAAREAGVSAESTRRSFRDQLWLFGVALVGFAVEWVSRRRRGMR
jgi:hypothetical protein